MVNDKAACVPVKIRLMRWIEEIICMKNGRGMKCETVHVWINRRKPVQGQKRDAPLWIFSNLCKLLFYSALYINIVVHKYIYHLCFYDSLNN